MANKDEVVEMAKVYGEYFEGREHCYTPWDFIPKTYVMWEPEDCKEILKILGKQETDDIKYMGKVARGSHRGRGISLLTLEEIHKLQIKYDYGLNCEQPQEDKFIIQKYMPNPLLINGRKMDFRCYMILASTDPLIVFYQDGLIRLAHDEFDEHSTDVSAHLTNLSVSKKEHGDKTAEEAMADAAWTMKQFEDYLVENKIVDESWFEAVMVPNMKRIIMHTVRSVSEKILRHPDTYELLGIDFLLDADLNLWLMEVTPNPQSQAVTPEIGEMKIKIHRDLIDMQYALMEDNWDLFDKIQSRSNFQYVYDGRKKGMDRYHGNLSEDCV